MSGDDKGIALLCTLYPASLEKQKRVPSSILLHLVRPSYLQTSIQILALLRAGARDYYRRPTSKCTTWSYFTPLLTSPKSDSNLLLIGGLEIYTHKSALQDQANDKAFFQAYHETARRESLYAKNEDLVAYRHAAGFLARDELAQPFGEGTIVSVTRLECRDRDAVVKALEGFVGFVREREPGVLTYAVFSRKKAPREVVLVVRYRNKEALRQHAEAREHVDVV